MSTPVPLRKRLLHLLLWCLAASAASGVLTVLVPQRDLLWRITAMGFVAVAAIGLMIPLSLLADRERFRTAGLFGMFACVGAFLISSGLIWAGLGGWRMEERFGLTLILVIFMSPAIVGLLCLRAWIGGRVAGVVGLFFAAAASVLFLIEIWYDDPISYSTRFGETGACICWCGVIATLSLIGLGTDSRHWRWVGAIGAVIGLAMWILGIWVIQSQDARYLVSVLTVSALAAFANCLLRVNLSGGQRLVLYGTLSAAAAVVAFINLDVHVQEMDYSDPFGFKRFTAGASIVTVSGTLAVIVLAMLNRRAMRKAAYAPRVAGGAPGERLSSITLRCPRCQKEQTLPLGESACSDCRLIIRTSVEVPVCTQCGYDISMIKADKCPECGAAIG